MLLRSYLLAGTASIALCGASTAAFSQETQTDSDTEFLTLDPVVVTETRGTSYAVEDAGVTRVPVPLIEVPQSIQVITPKLIEEQQVNTPAEALRNVSGVIPSAPSEIVLANPVVRGFEAEIYVDGLQGYGDTAVADPASLIGVERLEVAKGPSSVLYGGGSGAPVGGLINVVTKTPEDENFARARVRTGSFKTVAPSVDINFLVKDKIAIRLPGEYFSSEDYIDEVEVERITLNPSMRVDLAPETELLLRVGYNRVEQLEYAGLPAQLAELPGVDPFQFTGATDTPDTVIKNLTIHGAVTHQFSDTLEGKLQVRRFKNSFDEFATSPFFTFFPITGTSAPIIGGSLDVETTQWTTDASLTATFDTGPVSHTLIGGLTYDNTNYDGATGFDFTPIGTYNYVTEQPSLRLGAVPPLVNFLENEYKTLAGYVQNHMSIGDGLHVQVGGRFSNYSLEEIQGGQGTDEFYSRFDPRVGATLELFDGLSAFAGWSTGSRLSLFFAGAGGAAPKLETSRSVEGGFKFDVDDIGLSGTLAGFRNVRKNVPTPDPTTFITSVQTGEQRSMGAELDLLWEPTSQVSTILSMAYTDSEVTEDTTIPEGDGIPRVPEFGGRLASHYRFAGGLDGLGVGAGVTWATASEITLPNTFDADGYAVLDAQASYTWDRYRIGLTVHNLADTEYFVPYQYFAQAVVRPGAPRSAFVTLTADF